jgi:hypothetical protein
MRLKPLAVLGLLAAASASAQQPREKEAQRPLALTRVLECRAVPSAGERLACFDREVAAFEVAEEVRELVVYDREQIRRTRRSLFGIVLPDLNILGGRRDEGEASEGVSQIESTIRAIGQTGNNRYVFTIEDGARWVQIDDRELSATPRAGQKVRIRRAAMGSYLANIGGNVAIRVRRIMPSD